MSKASGDTAPYDRKGRLRAILEAAGLVFNKTAECWVHKTQDHVISEDTVFAHDEPWLKALPQKPPLPQKSGGCL